MIRLGKKIITIWNQGESDSTPIIYDEAEWEERLNKSERIRLETLETNSSQEIKSALDFLSYLIKFQERSDFFKINKGRIEAGEFLMNSFWRIREEKIKNAKQENLRSINDSLKLIKEIDPNLKIEEREIKELEEEIELGNIQNKGKEILKKIKEFVSQLVKEDFELIKKAMSEEERNPFEITIGKDLSLQSWVMLFEKMRKKYGDYLSIKKNFSISLSRIEQVDEENSWLSLSEYLKILKDQRELIKGSEQEATWILLEEIDQKTEKIEKLLTQRLKIEIWRKVENCLKNSRVNINEEEINKEINKAMGVNNYHKLIDERSLDDLWEEMSEDQIVRVIKNIEQKKRGLVKKLIQEKLNKENSWQNDILFYDIKKGIEFFNWWEIVCFFLEETIFKNSVSKLKEDFNKIGELLQKIENINDNVRWEDLQKISKEFSEWFSEENKKRDPFIRKLFDDNKELIKCHQEKLKSELESYIKREQDLVNQLAINWKNLEKSSSNLIEFRKKLNQPWQWVKEECQNKWIKILNSCQLYQQAFTGLEDDFREAKKVQDLSNLDQLKKSEKVLESWLNTNDLYKINAREHNNKRIKEEKEKIHSLHETYKNLTAELAKDSKSVVKLEKIKRNLEEWQNPTDNEELKKLVSQNWAEIIRTKITEIDNKITEIQKIEKEKIINVLLTSKTATLSSLVIISLLISSLLWWKRKALESLLLSNRKPVIALSPWLNCQHCDEAMEIWQEKNLIVNCGGCSN